MAYVASNHVPAHLTTERVLDEVGRWLRTEVIRWVPSTSESDQCKKFIKEIDALLKPERERAVY